MDQIKNLLRNYMASGSINATSRQLKVSKNTIREYIRRAEVYSTDLAVVLELDEETLNRIFYAADSDHSSARLAVFEQQIECWLKELRRTGVTRELLWQEYRREHPDGFGYSQLPVNQWHEYLNAPTLADAILYRLTANSHRIELQGNSMRQLSNS